MSDKIRITSRTQPPEVLRTELAPHVSGVGLEVVPDEKSHRGALSDPTVLVAVVSSAGATIGMVLNGVFSLMAARRARAETIVIAGADGARVEFPADLDPEKIEQLVELTRALDAPTIELP